MGYDIWCGGKRAMIIDPAHAPPHPDSKWRVCSLESDDPGTYYGDTLEQALGPWRRHVEQPSADPPPRLGDPESYGVWLRTRTGERVAEVELPPLAVPPEIIQWNQRFFVRQIVGGAGWRYYEGLVLAVQSEDPSD